MSVVVVNLPDDAPITKLGEFAGTAISYSKAWYNYFPNADIGLENMASLTKITRPTDTAQLVLRLSLLATIALFNILFLSAATASSSHEMTGRISAFGAYNDSFDSWLVGSWGRFETGSDYSDHNIDYFNELQFQYSYENDLMGLDLHVQYRNNSDNSGQDFGLVELKAFTHWELDKDKLLTLTAGQFFLPTTMENIDSFWESPYTLTFSSINSWIATEFRPIGIDMGFETITDAGNRFSHALTLFGGNDSMGTQLAWQGWMYHHRRSVSGEELPLPNLKALGSGGAFAEQADFGSTSFGKDLDNRIGYALRSSYSIPDELILQATWVDNRGDRNLHSGEYSWDTRFAMAGMEWHPLIGWVVAAEFMQGSTGMGAESGPHVDVDFWSGYLLASYNTLQWRYTLRLDRFLNEDRDHTPYDLNEDSGESYTFAAFWEYPNSNIRFGLEAIHTVTKRLRVTPKGFFKDGNASQYLLMASYTF